MPHESGSFDYKVINPLIRNVLDNRSDLNNTIQMAMPFIKATTTIQIPELTGGIGFTLGLHAIDEDVRYEDIYSDRGSDMPLIGYTYVNGKTKRIYAFNKAEDIASQVFDRRAGVFTNTNNFIRIPPPGITNVTIGRNKNGLLAHAQLTIAVPSLVQLESLHKTFLIPGVGMVLEWGQQFAVESLRTNVTGELPDISYATFPWYNKDRTLQLLTRLGQNAVGLQEILTKYAYASSGQYMWMFGRVANFNITMQSDGSYQVTVKIVGPSEDSWAYDTVNTVTPRKDPSTKFFCASETNSVVSYFSQTANGGVNFKSLLDNPPSEWKDHVIKFEKGNKKGGEPTADQKDNNTSETSFANLDDAYFMTWRFFVNVVLNDTNRGVKSIFASALDENTLNKIGMLMPYKDGPQRTGNVATLSAIDDPMEPYVGYNKYLRSIDPSVMIIVNETAANLASQNPQYNATSVSQKFLDSNKDSAKFKKAGTFDGIAPDRGFLSTGVWLNHKTIVECMVGGDTILRGITNLLERMNRASLKYWDLAIDISEPTENMTHSYNYMVIDTNLRENSQNAVNKFIDNVHVFNKYVRVASGKLVGSELIECNIDLSLPKRLFSQIATLGLVTPEDMKKVGVDEEPKSAKLSDPNDTLRRLFAITVINPASDTDQGPDLTILPRAERVSTGICGQANVQTPAQTGGNSNKAGNISVEEASKNKSAEDIQKENEKAQKFLNSKECGLCKQCEPQGVSGEGMSFPPDANLNQAAATLLAREEGLPRGGKAYYDPPSQTNLVSIGYGHQIKEGEYSQGYIQAGDERIPIIGSRGIDTVMTAAQARKLLEIDVTKYVNAARAPLGDAWNKLTINQKVALTSYAYNTGSTRSLVKAGILNTIDQNDSAGTAQLIRDRGTRTANGQVLQVLVNRRAREAALFGQDPIGQGATSPTNPSATQNTGTCTDQQYLNISLASKPAGAFIGGLLGASVADGKDICVKCKRAQQIQTQTSAIVESNKKAQAFVEEAVRQFPELQKIFRYVEIFPEYMVAEIADIADGNFANAYGASPGSLSISGDLVMPGINGLRVGELFWIDRIPSFYKIFGAFQIMSIEDTIDVSGWKTKVHARFNYLGKAWKEAMTQKVNNQIRASGVSNARP